MNKIKSKSSQRPTGAGKVRTKPEQGPCAGHQLWLDPYSRTLEFTMGKFRGYYASSHKRFNDTAAAIWISTL